MSTFTKKNTGQEKYFLFSYSDIFNLIISTTCKAVKFMTQSTEVHCAKLHVWLSCTKDGRSVCENKSLSLSFNQRLI